MLARSKRRSTLTRLLMNTFAILAVFSLFTLPVSANSGIKTIQHVYVDQQYVGVVTDEKVVNDAIAEVVETTQKDYSDVELEVQNEVTFVPEQVFRVKAADEQVVSTVKEQLKVEAKAIAIKDKDNTLVYVNNEKTAEQVLEQLKYQHLSEKEVEVFKKAEESKEERKELTEEGSQVLAVQFEEELKTEAATIAPKEVVDAKEAVTILNKGTLEEKKHKIASGDVLGSIANKYDLTTKELMKLNEGVTEDTVLQIDDELNVTVTKPLIHVLVEKEVYKEEIIDYEIETVKNDSLPKGETKVKQEGKEGKKAITYKVIEKNGKQTKETVEKEVELEKPLKKIIEEGTKVVVQQVAPSSTSGSTKSTNNNTSSNTTESTTPSRGSGKLVWPASGGYVSSGIGTRWGSMHKGIDIARPSDYNIKAADSGVVVSAGWDGGYGNKIVIDHQNGMRTVYAHLASINVSPGQSVSAGQSIGVMGKTGDSTGIHLHFEVYVNGALKNGLDYF